MEDVPQDPLQEDGTSQLKRSSVEDAELPELSCLTSKKPRISGHQFMEHRVDQGRSVSPTPSYLSMKSEQSMDIPAQFKEGDRTEEKEVQLERSGSPTPSCVSMRSDSSMGTPITFRDGGSTERFSEGLCDPCSDDDTERRAVKFCPTCTLSYCEKHVRRHYTSAVYKMHTLVDVAEEVRSLGEERLQKPNSINVLPPPGQIQFLSVKSDSVTLRWGSPEGLEGPMNFKVTWEGDGEEKSLKVKDINKVEITGLQPGQKYQFSVATEGDHGNQSKCVSASTYTGVPVPVKLTVVSVDPTSATLSWEPPGGMDQTHLQYQVSYQCPGGEQHTTTSSVSITLSDLRPASEYSVSVCSLLDNGQKSLAVSQTFTTRTQYTVGVSTVLEDGERSETVSTTIHTDSILHRILDSLGIRCFLDKKLTIDQVREIRQNVSSDQTATNLQSQLQLFLERLLMLNMKARSLKRHNDQDSSSSDGSSSDDEEEKDRPNDMNPLDLITALFLCSDGILQQELSLKMSLCQFAVPLLLPNPDTQQSTLMQWAMRDIVKQFRSHSPDDKNEFVDKSVVCTELPMISFVRLGSSSLPKSKFLNEILSNSQQTNNTFVHHNMTGGNIPKKISDGLVEMSWYLPSGNPDIDIFNEPVAVANLRGDLEKYQTQFAFLCQTSAAVFVFCDDLQFDTHSLSLQSMKIPVFIVCDSQSMSHAETSLKELAAELKKNSGRVIRKGQGINEADFVKKIRSAVKDVLKSKPFTIKVEKMADVAHDLGIPVDEDYGPCQSAKAKAAKTINDSQNDIPKFKDSQLPLQGSTWKELTTLEKKEGKLLEPDENIVEHKKKLRKTQIKRGMSESIKYFIEGLKSSIDERSYFIKWMKINLDNLSRTQLSELRRKFQDKCQESTENKQLITSLNMQISNCSLGTEHFLREVGQLYEACMYFAETTDLKKEIQDLPRICAELMLAGFPLELMDGDTSNIPMTWITEVLKELDSLTKPNNKIRVVTVLGCQSSGKSTLLNTLFGVQFAVSSGRCTRGAFMQLIKIQHDFKKVIKCDFIMIIDTEGLKAVQLSHLTDNYEHDNELATLVVGLSDISIVNIAMESNSEVRDILQIVAHAFLRMKESEKTPTCQFVHQNVTDVSAPEKIPREQNVLLEQLNEMTRAASRMENMAMEHEFTDIINYKAEDNYYLPGLWHGSPPMAPVNQGYSEGVTKIKNNLIVRWTSQNESAGTFLDFCKSVRDVWTAVKYENFIFSFRNSLVAQAYNKLSQEFGRWDWDFEKSIYNWLGTAETRVENYGLLKHQEESGLDAFEEELKTEANNELEREGNVFLNKVINYYTTRLCDVQLLEKYKEEFKTCAQSKQRVMERIVQRKLGVAVDLKKCTFKVDNIKKNNKEIMDKKVSDLVTVFQDKQEMTDHQIEQELDMMWNETLKQLKFKGLEPQNVAQHVTTELRSNLEREGPKVKEMLKNSNLTENCGKDLFQVKDANFMKKTMNKFSTECKTIDKNQMQKIANDIITKCETLVKRKVNEKKDYHPVHTRELLELVQENLNQHNDLYISPENAAALKIHICGHAAREFQSMHDAFIRDNDPKQNLLKLKTEYLNDFKDLYCKKDMSERCKRKAEEFTNNCLQPAVIKYIQKYLGLHIYDNIVTTRSSFQMEILKTLSLADSTRFLQYIDDYHTFAKKVIQDMIISKYSSTKIRYLMEICGKIRDAIAELQKIGGNLNFTQFRDNLCTRLSDVLVISNDITGLVVKDVKVEEFSKILTECIIGMETRLKLHSDHDVLENVNSLPNNPYDKLYHKMLGCKNLCPDCKAPCDAEGDGHWWHSSTTHRPMDFQTIEKKNLDKLSIEMCTHIIISQGSILPKLEKAIRRQMFWRVQPYEAPATEYWKFIFAKHNEEYAKACKCLPADIPHEWKAITREQALLNLTKVFNSQTN